MSCIRIGLTLVACAIPWISGCVSTAGPFVTNISSDGHGGLVVEKAMVEYNYWTSTVSTKNVTTSTIYTKPSPDNAGNKE